MQLSHVPAIVEHVLHFVPISPHCIQELDSKENPTLQVKQVEAVVSVQVLHPTKQATQILFLTK